MAHRILVVDDDPHIREVLAFALRKAGMEVDQAGDGEEAMARIIGSKPDLVILDINMPMVLSCAVGCAPRAGPTPSCRSSFSPRATTRSTASLASSSAVTIMS